MTPQEQLVEAAKRALTWFDNYNAGTARNNQHDAVLIPRALYHALAEIELDGMTDRAEVERRELVDRR